MPRIQSNIVCPLYVQSRCNKGDACHFVHPEQQSGESWMKFLERVLPKGNFCIGDYSRWLMSLFPRDIPNAKQLMINTTGVFSITPPSHARQILAHLHKYVPRAECIMKTTLVDMTASVGGFPICWRRDFHDIVAIEMSPQSHSALVHNVAMLNTNNITVINANSLNYIQSPIVIGAVVVIDAPWTGTDYKTNETMKLFLDNDHGDPVDIEDIAIEIPARVVMLKVPNNYDFEHTRLNITSVKNVINAQGSCKYKIIFVVK